MERNIHTQNVKLSKLSKKKYPEQNL